MASYKWVLIVNDHCNIIVNNNVNLMISFCYRYELSLAKLFVSVSQSIRKCILTTSDIKKEHDIPNLFISYCQAILCCENDLICDGQMQMLTIVYSK